MVNYNLRPEVLGNYIVENKCTIRHTAKVFNISKSSVHLDVSKRLKNINFALYSQVKLVLTNNFNERNIRGGFATKQKYLKKDG